MGIKRDNLEIGTSIDILRDKWKINEVEAINMASKPGYCLFNNTIEAIKLLGKHIKNDSKIVLSTDVDMDGVGTTYILERTLRSLGVHKPVLLINKEKVHGVQQVVIDYFKDKKIDLMIITDSSSNEVELIKQFNCDVLCIDHHELLHRELSGTCNDGVHKFIIVNNTIDNLKFDEDKKWLEKINKSAFESMESYLGTNAMSCGLVVYEFLRIFCKCYYTEELLENLMLYQWVGVTLFTDAIDTLNKRNQWYIDKTVNNMNTESTLFCIMNKLNRYKARLDKVYIQYTFAPLINKAIRAGESSKALDIVMNHPEDINELQEYAELQKQIIDKVVNITDEYGVKTPRRFSGKYIKLDVTEFNVGVNYNGVIASHLSGENMMNTCVYIRTAEGKCKGSFRGIYPDINYRGYFENYDKSIYAQGHKPAFGFELYEDQLIDIMEHINEIEPKGEIKPYIDIKGGNGVYNTDSIEDLRKLGYLYKIGIGNAKVASKDEILIRIKASDIRLKEQIGKLYMYDLGGIDCKAFKLLKGDYFNLYIENSTTLEFYLK